MDGHVTLAGRHAGGFTDRGARARDGSIESIPEEPFGPSGALRESERAKRILEYKYMRWIDEMFVNMEKERSDGLARKIEKAAKVDRPEHLKKQIPGTLKAWNSLVSSITSDVNNFNNCKERAGHTMVRVSKRNLECEVHLSGMQGKTLVLALDNQDLHVSVRPDFPEQKLTITLELDRDGQHASWVLGESNKENAKLSDQQLSEYLLKPVLSSASINGSRNCVSNAPDGP